MNLHGYRFQDYIPKLFSCLKEGYSKKLFFGDLFAGMSVGVISLPLALAFAIGSGVAPERGLFTAIIAGFLISFLGGSRVQIGGPTGAFIVIVYAIIQKHGYEGLAVATIIGGLLMVLMGIARFGVFLKFIPFPVTTGFTTGIALSIFTSQIKDFLGLQIAEISPHFFEKWGQLFQQANTWNAWAFFVGMATLVFIFIVRKYFPKWPAAILAIIIPTALCFFFSIPLETVESKFGHIPRTIPSISFPLFSYDLVKEVFPDAIAIALLGAIESLLSAAIADGITGTKHRSNCELIAQGIANIGSIIFGGIPATGAVARTSANINMGAKTPVAGIIHAATLFLLMILFAPLVDKIPLCTLSAVLIYVAWNMSELPHFIEILKGQKSEALVLLTTFLLTILIDLSVAVQVGVILAAVIFVKKMADSTSVEVCKILLKENENESPELQDSEILFRKDVPEEITVFEIKGPFFYSVADLLKEALMKLEKKPKVFILRMQKVPIVDTTGMRALKEFQLKCKQTGILFLLSGVSSSVRKSLRTAKVESSIGKNHLFPDIHSALSYAKKNLQKTTS